MYRSRRYFSDMGGERISIQLEKYIFLRCGVKEKTNNGNGTTLLPRDSTECQAIASRFFFPRLDKSWREEAEMCFRAVRRSLFTHPAMNRNEGPVAITLVNPYNAAGSNAGEGKISFSLSRPFST